MTAEPEHGAPLVHAVLELTNACNLRCPHCASGSGLRREGELGREEWLGLLREIVALGAESVTLIGGELLLSPDWLSVARGARELGLGVGIITNGLLVDGPRLRDLASLGLDALGVSLDGASPEPYRAVRGVDGFERVWRTIRQARDLGAASVTAITTLCRTNLAEVEPLHELLEGQGVTWQVQFASSGSSRFDRSLFVSPEEHGEVCLKLGELMLAAGTSNWIATTDDFGYFPLDARHHLLHAHFGGCQAGRTVLGVRSNGDLLGCLSLGDAFVDENVRGRSLRALWRAPGTFAALRRKTAATLTGGCSGCAAARPCRGGCTAMATSSTGSMYENRHCLRRLETDRLLAELADAFDR